MEPRTDVTETRALDKVIRIDEAQVQAHLSEMVRSSVEETLNALLDAEADRLCQAKRYKCTSQRQDTRAGSYQRDLHTKAGEVTLKVPKLRSLPSETAIIERYQRRETSVEEALIEMYLTGVSVRRVEDVTEALWGTRVSPRNRLELVGLWGRNLQPEEPRRSDSERACHSSEKLEESESYARLGHSQPRHLCRGRMVVIGARR